METPQKAPDTAVWYFIGATFMFALGPMVFSAGDPGAWQVAVFVILGMVVMACGVVVFVRERRQRKQIRGR